MLRAPVQYAVLVEGPMYAPFLCPARNIRQIFRKFR
jgi:hypothetical protein